MLLEHKLPHSPKRVNVCPVPAEPKHGRPPYVLVELKQWSKPEPYSDDLVQVHPVEQVRRYC